MNDIRVRLSTLWIFVLLNYLYCDIVGLMDSELLRQFLTGSVGGMHISQGFLLGGSVLMEIPIAMIVLSRLLERRANRLANIVAGTIMTVVQTATLLAGAPTGYYMFFSAVEISCTALIVWIAWTWRAAVATPAPVPLVPAATSPESPR